MDAFDSLRIALAFGSGIAVTWFGHVMRARVVKQASDDERVVKWAQLLGSMETSVSGLCVRLDALDSRMQQLDRLPYQVDAIARTVADIQSKVARQAVAFDEHSKEETQLLRELRASNGG